MSNDEQDTTSSTTPSTQESQVDAHERVSQKEVYLKVLPVVAANLQVGIAHNYFAAAAPKKE